MSAYIKRTERSQINDIMLHLKLLEKQEQANPKTNRKREIIKIRAETNAIETNKPKKYKESIKQKAGSLKKKVSQHCKDYTWQTSSQQRNSVELRRNDIDFEVWNLYIL
jgi:hypothetical protein